MSEQLSQESIDYLRKFYNDLNNPAAYSGPQKLYEAVKAKGEKSFSYNQIQRFLHSEDTYSLQKPIRHRFRRQRVVVTHIDEEYEADLMVVQNLAKENDNIKYLLVVIDIFSRFLWIEPLQDKTSKNVITGFKNIFKQGRTPEKLRTDKGSEFVNRWVKNYLKSQGIDFFTTQNTETKASFVERVIRTFRAKLFRYFTQKHTYRYIDHLQDLVYNYNITPHRSLNNESPISVNGKNEADLWAFQYLNIKKKSGKEKRKKLVYS